ncbi:MAG: hypothetical protein KJ970_21175 [Candidatus Eisenbacteria bacterium]|uniref:Uncharacterized protein n=1 Tax=Eiseniibacteriota bacterium TaxID=2212470 RepID=A0A948RYN3_UNCEI|nr:hypothetical protein [Candidatus Eisenbacteria bacterium]MBU2693438.1 hypothetical protein [Candidatus Eisenbacteria bacterium]
MSNEEKTPKDDGYASFLKSLESDDDWHRLFSLYDKDDLDWLDRVAVLLGVEDSGEAE